MFYGGKVVCGPVHFFLCCSFSPQCSPWHFSFSHHRYKIFMFFFQQNWSPLFFICHSSSFSVIHINVDIKIKSKERIGFVVVIFLSLKVRVAMQFNDEMQGYLKCKISPQLTWRGWRTYEQDPCMHVRMILSEPKFLGYIDKQTFLSMVLRCMRFACKRAPLKPKNIFD